MKGKQLASFVAAASMAWFLCGGGPLVAQLASPSDTQTYRLINADAATVGPQLSEMLKEYEAAAEVLIDRTQNQLVLRGPEASRQLADSDRRAGRFVAQTIPRVDGSAYRIRHANIAARGDRTRRYTRTNRPIFA